MTQDSHIKNWNFKRYTDPVILTSTGLLILALCGAFFAPGWLTIVLVSLLITIWCVVLYFFRDPARNVLEHPGLVVGPCDGKVVAIDIIHESTYLGVETIRVSMFLSLFNVHVQRAPLEGKVISVDHKPGEFLQAFKPEASDVNEYIAMHIETFYGDIIVKQISGILARRCVNYAQPGDFISTGQRFGHIRFGSRVDLFLPVNSKIKINVGDKIFGGLTPIAQLFESDDE